ncbi:MAG: hypothetical protein Q7S27_01345 [Nanoarchaeota archaeon]|nr:hypothetical protein [Nanoarchaeota archaeon]
MPKKNSRDYNTMGIILIGLGAIIAVLGLVLMGLGLVPLLNLEFSGVLSMAIGMFMVFIGGSLIMIGIYKKSLGSIGAKSGYIAKETAWATEKNSEALAKGLAKGFKKGLREK